MSLNVDLRGRRILVTGASSGIGAATCRSIVGCGGSVAMLARRKARLDELAEELGPQAIGIPADVTDLDALKAAVGAAARALNGLDGAVAVAGQTFAGGMVSGSPQAWRDLMDVNLIGPLATVRYAYQHFADAGRRDVVVVGSTGAITPMPASGPYSGSKAGLRAACESLRLELAPAGVSVGFLMPGMFDTAGLTLEGLVLDGDIPPNDFPLLADGGAPGDPAVLGDTIAFMLGLPDGIAINEMVVRPTRQLNP